MKSTEKVNKTSARVFLIGLVCVGIIITAMCISYVNLLERTMAQETDAYLSEVSEHISSMVNYRVQVGIQALAAIAENYMQSEDEEHAAEYLKSKAGQFGYRRLGVLGMDGISHTTDGHTVDMSYLPSIQRALKGESNATGLLASKVDGIESMIYAVPLKKDGEVTGALVGISAKNAIRDFLSVESFGGEGFSQIIDLNGDFIIKADHKNTPSEGANFFELLENHGTLQEGYSLERMREDIKDRRAGGLYYSLEDGIEKIVRYAPLEMNGWYLLSIIPTKAVNQKTAFFINLSIVIITIVAVSFLLLISLVLFMQRRNQKRLERIAYEDPVTGGYNQKRFDMEAGELVGGAPGGTYAVVSADIRQFKLINDGFGSEIGNLLLKHVHDKLWEGLRDGELICRITADTFALLMKNDGRESIAGRLDKAVGEINQFNWEREKKYYLRMIEGVYVVDDPTLDMIVLEDRANVARKNHKETCGTALNTCVFYTDLDRLRMVREKEIENKMQDALKNHEFEVYLQPKIELKGETVAGAEALVRWNDPEYGLISPAEFIPVFEKNGFIVNLDLYMFEQVCRLLRSWIEKGYEPVPVSVNFSHVHLKNPDFLKEFRAIFQTYKLPPKLLEIELTETLVFENLDLLLKVIDQFHEIGFDCSLDDFGSGYSSLNILKDVPVDTLKLDRGFFSGAQQKNDRGGFVVESIIELARKLKMQTVSEGVESMEQVEFLKKANCDMVQGYVYARPVPAADFEKKVFCNPPVKKRR